jgi:large subunit ribosomal protein L17
MRHNKKFNHLSRKTAHRKAMLSNMASSLILHKRISTTVAKAKALKVYVEPLMTKSKNDTTHSRRIVFSYLQDKIAVSELFRDISPKIMDRPGGYTRILKTGNRLGDNAEMCIIELVDYNENMLGAKEETKKSSSRRRRGGKKKSEASEKSETTQAQQPKADADATQDEKSEATAKEETVEKAADPKSEAPKAEESKKVEADDTSSEDKKEDKE